MEGKQHFETPDGMSGLRVRLSLSGTASAAGGRIKTATIGERPFTIGRDPGCDWVVQDEESRISRHHCEFRSHGDTLVLIDRSTNGTFVGDERSRAVKGQPTPLTGATAIFIGGARIDVEFGESAEAVDLETDYFGVGQLPPRSPDRADRARGELDLGAPGEDEDDPFPMADPSPSLSLEDEVPQSVEAAFRPGIKDPRALPESRSPDPLEGGLPDDWADDLDLEDAGNEGGDPLASLEQVLDDDVPPPSGPAGGGLEADPPSASPRAPPDLDPVAREELTPPDPGPGPAAPSAPHGRAPTPTHDPEADSPAAGPEATIPPARPAAPPQAPAGRGGSELEPLLRSLGFRPEELEPERQAEIAAEVGRVAVTMAEGLNRLLAQRRDTKIALGVRATQYEFGANPLMWSSDGRAALREILEPRSEAYQHGTAAVEQAVEQLVANQLALVGAVKATIKVAIASFAPKTLEERLEGGLGEYVPQLRKAKLWDRYVDRYDQFVAQTNEDVRSVLGRELDRLYDSASASVSPKPETAPDAPEQTMPAAGRSKDGLDL